MSIFDKITDIATQQYENLKSEVDSKLNSCRKCGRKITPSEEYHFDGVCEDCHYDSK